MLHLLFDRTKVSMGWWADSTETQWVYNPNETKTCKHCSQGLTPQQHQAHEVACACNRHIANVECQQRQLEADIMNEAISNARCACMTIQICEHLWLSMMPLFHLTNGTCSSVFAACHCYLLIRILSLLTVPMEMLLTTIPMVSLLCWKIWVSFKQVCLNNICAPLALISARFGGSRTTSWSSNCLLWLSYSSAWETSLHVCTFPSPWTTKLTSHVITPPRKLSLTNFHTISPICID